ncbi:putative phosphoesterase, ICC [Mycobacteroides abscessus subsp. abscessus]|uniref:metallophosphoesterase family protein n=1 Tax=Mycobacteroides abscessus TaxID=36809 RepID=UPI000929051E|nr:metallophosphoesterase [Mycobacteroides abscessus]SIH19313.1 putative phosphoesterase, ICC [Mycobacteroides abscessus subsp. abscessus]
MRLLALADSAHNWPRNEEGRYDLSGLVREHQIDAMISLGDFSPVHADAMQRAQAPLTAGVRGNHCTQEYMPEHGIVDLVGDRTRAARRGTLQLPGHRNVTLLAVQGCVRYKPDTEDVLFTQEQYARDIERIPGAELVITHCPPAGVNDAEDLAHSGIEALRRWMDQHRPRWLLHGHTYQNPERSMHGDTEVIYVNGYSVIDLPLNHGGLD